MVSRVLRYLVLLGLLCPVLALAATPIISTSHSAGGHTLALKSDGTVLAWGWNGWGQIGEGTLVDRPSPVAIVGLSNVVAVAVGSAHSVAPAHLPQARPRFPRMARPC